MKNIIYLLLILVFLSIFLPMAQAMTTTGTEAGVNETVTWTINGISDNDIHFSSSVTGAATEYFYYLAPLRKGSTAIVSADIPDARQLTSEYSTQRSLNISIPDAGTRWKAEKACTSCSPTSVSLDHLALYSPYQAVPAYPGFIEADKAIVIEDATFTFENGWQFLEIVIMPQDLIGLSNDEENGLPKHARTEPDFKTKKPYGCNGCATMGLPGYRVNMFNLRPVIQDTLFQWSGRGASPDLTLTWNTGVGVGYTNFGTGWRFSYDAWLEESSSGVTLQQDTGGQLHFDIPPSGNANVISISVNPDNGDSTVVLGPSDPLDPPNYTAGWDGKFISSQDGYRLEKVLDGDPVLKTFILYTPDEKLSYVFQGPSGTMDLVPLIAIEDWNGNQLKIMRNASGAITEIRDAVNRSAYLTYNTAGQCSAITVPGGGQLHFSYSGTDLVQSLDLMENQTNYTYNAGKFVTSMSTEGRTWQFAWSNFDGHDYLSAVTDPQGAITGYTILVHAGATYRTQVTDPTGRSFTYDYPSGQYSESSRPQAARVIADNKGRPVEIYQKGMNTYPRTLEYDDDGNVTKMTNFEGGIHTYTYNDRGQVTQYVDALDNTWSNEYDSHGNRTRAQSPAGRIYQYTYNVQGELTQEIDPEGNIRYYTYNSFGNLKTVTDAVGSVTTYLYDTQGINLTGITDPLGNTTSFAYDDNRRLTRTTHPDGTYREHYYDCCAENSLRNENGDIRTVTRTPSLQVTQESDYLGNTTIKTYDAAGRMITSRDPLGRITRTDYNNLGLAASVQDPLGNSISWTYDQRDTLLSHDLCQNPPAQASIYTSGFGIPAEANGWKYVRDKMGRLLSIITPRDNWKTINYSRDADGLMTGKDIDGASVATFVRDGNGMLASSTHALGTDNYIRTGRGQVTQQTWYDGKSVTFGYDEAGRLRSVTYPDSSNAIYTYDSRGRITQVTWKDISLETEYDAVGAIKKEIRSNGVTTDITNDKNSMHVRMHHYSTTQEYLDLQGSRNANNLITRIQESGDVPTWIPQLTPEIIRTAFAYNLSFTVVSRNGQAASTDSGGNQTSIPGSRSFAGTYNFLDLLTEWTAAGSSNSAVYDGQRRLVQWTRNGATRKFHYDEMGRLLFETNGTGTVTASWLYRDNQIVAMADSGGVYFYHADLSGNVAFLTDKSANIAARYRYLPYGLQADSVTTVQNPFTFVGIFGVLDLEDGLYYMGSRTYDAEIRAFLSNDPIGMGVAVNARGYARNNPVNLIDPDGRTSRYPSEWGNWMAPGSANRNNAGPRMQYPATPARSKPKSSGNTIDPCKIENTIWNTLGTGKYGGAAGTLKVLHDLQQASYGEAIYDAAGTILGKINPIAGAIPMFMGVSKMGNAELPGKYGPPRPVIVFSNNKKEYHDPREFTLTPFPLDE